MYPAPLSAPKDCLVAEHLRHTGADADDLGYPPDEFVRRVFVQPRRQIRLPEPAVLLRMEKDVGKLVDGVGAIRLPAADEMLKPIGNPAKNAALLVLRR